MLKWKTVNFYCILLIFGFLRKDYREEIIYETLTNEYQHYQKFKCSFCWVHSIFCCFQNPSQNLQYSFLHPRILRSQIRESIKRIQWGISSHQNLRSCCCWVSPSIVIGEKVDVDEAVKAAIRNRNGVTWNIRNGVFYQPKGLREFFYPLGRMWT